VRANRVIERGSPAVWGSCAPTDIRHLHYRRSPRETDRPPKRKVATALHMTATAEQINEDYEAAFHCSEWDSDGFSCSFSRSDLTGSHRTDRPARWHKEEGMGWVRNERRRLLSVSFSVAVDWWCLLALLAAGTAFNVSRAHGTKTRGSIGCASSVYGRETECRGHIGRQFLVYAS